MKRFVINRFLKTCVLVGVVLSATATAQDKFKAAAQTDKTLINDVDQAKISNHLITRYLEQSTFALVEIDITKVDVIETMKLIKELAATPRLEHFMGFAGSFSKSREELVTAGVSKIYLTVAPRNLLEGGIVAVVPCKDTAVVNGMMKTVAQVLSTKVPHKTHVAEDAVILGPDSAVDRLVAAVGTKRADLIAPLFDVSPLDHTLSLSPSDETRNELKTLWPDETPESFPVRLSPRAMIADVNRVVVSWSLPPKAELITTIKATDKPALDRVQEAVEKIVDLLPGADKAKIKVTTSDQAIVVAMSIEQTAQLLATLAKPARTRADRLSEMNDMKQIMLAFHNYAAANQHFPPRMLVDQNKKPLHSWRTVLLPYLEQRALYESMKLDEPWDSKHNIKFGKTVIPTFNAAMRESDKPWRTCVRAAVFEGGIWGGKGKPLMFPDITDGTSNTIAFIVAPVQNATVWSSPDAWEISKDDPMKDVFGESDNVVVGMLDGSARVLTRKDMTNEKLAALLTRAGREEIDW